MIDRPLKLLFVIGTLSGGGAERMLSVITNEFVKHGVDVHICCLEQSENENNCLLPEITYSFLDRKKKHKYSNILHRLYSLRRIIKKTNPDAVIPFMVHNALQSALCTIGMKTIIIMRVASIPENDLNSKIARVWGKYLWRRIKGAFFQSELQQEAFSSYLSCKTIVLPNPIADNDLWTLPKDYTNKTILTAGRLVLFKNHSLLVNAFAELVIEFPDWQLEICGEGKLRDALTNEIEQLNLQDRIHIRGFVSDVFNRMYTDSIFAFTSDYEGMPNALIEAMCMGCACVVTDFHGGSLPTLITDQQNGIIVPVNDKEALTLGLRRLMSSPELRERLGQEATKLRTVINVNGIYRKWNEYIHSVLEN